MMCENSEEDILEMLNSIFTKCDIDGNGFVDINTLVHFLICQDSTWHKDKTIEEEFRKVLCCNGLNQRISKDHFITSLLSSIKSKTQLFEENNDNENPLQEVSAEQFADKNQSPEIIFANVANNIINSEVGFVADGQTLTNEDVAEEISVSDCESSPVNKQFLKSLQDEIQAVQRKNEYLESVNNSLLSQISSLEDVIMKNEKESASDSNKLLVSHQLLEMQKQKQEEIEEKLSLFVDSNKSVTIQLSHAERENSKLKEFIVQLEKQIDLISCEKLFQDTKLKDIKEKYNVLNDLFLKSQEELESLKIKDKTGEELYQQLTEQNANLRLQLDSSDSLVQDLKTQLGATCRELSNLQNKTIKAKIQPSTPSDDQSSDSMIFFDGNFTLDSTIPFERSLLAELQDKETRKPCSCDCLRDLSFITSSPVSSEKSHITKTDIAVGTEKKKISHQATMTTFQDGKAMSPSRSCRDVGVNCTLKKTFTENMYGMNDCKVCLVRSKRSLTKWLLLGFILLLLCFLIGFVSSLSILSNLLKRSPKRALCLSSILELFQISKNHLPPH
uniref:EF-hand domain-containing protein n=1 Tax=Cuerna arida TaxID=1464854 RepID=A0A1B6ESY4_9HEMI